MNENTNTITYKCKWCGESLSPSHKGPCPKCGKVGKKIYVTLHGKITFKGSLERELRREFYKENPKIKWLVIAIEVVAFILGLILRGLLGAIVSAFFVILSHKLAPYAVIKVREITHYKS